MTSNIKDLIDSTIYLTYNIGIQPSEIDRLTTHEMREFMNVTKEWLGKEHERNSNVFSSLSKLFGLGRKGR